jgi:glucose/arabinose dehydrogenase
MHAGSFGFARGLAACALLAVLGGCGGGADGDAQAGGDRAQPLAVAVPWSRVAVEGGSFVTTGTQTVRFGTGTSWLTRSVTGTGECTRAFFGGDPAVGIGKVCEVQAESSGPRTIWARFAGETQAFALTGTQTVRYGVDTRWLTRSVTNNGICSSAFFGGDPAVGIAKACEGVQWSHVALDQQGFALARPSVVRYGADARWVEKTLSGNLVCSLALFGTDPAPRTIKTCQLKGTLPLATQNTPPSATITSPAPGATFAAGDTLVFSGSASDLQEGTLPAGRLAWWAELHHDTHTHPFQPQTTGGSGRVTIPVRGETSPNIWYRFHLRATDAGGASVEVHRDVLPRKAQVTLATSPTGLALTLDGQPVATPTVFTGVVGIERDLGAADQVANGRRWRFAGWSDGGAASHSISTPVANTTYVATFTDLGPVANTPPSVALSAPANGSTGTTGTPITIAANAADTDGTVTSVEFQVDGARVGAVDTGAPYAVSWTPATTGSHTLRAIATDDLGATTTSAAVTVTIVPPTSDTQPPQATLTAPADFAAGLGGTLAVSAIASDNVGVTGVEFQLDGVPIGATDITAPYGVTVDTNAYASGQHIVRVRARDAAGNVSAWDSATIEFGGSRTQPAGFTRTTNWVGGLSSASAFTQAPDGRFFVAQQTGALRIVKNGVLLAAPFLTVAVDAQGERGLVGVALHPGFASNRYVYVYYTTTTGGTHNRISRFTASTTNPDVVQAGSEQVLVELPALSSATNHNGGAMHFGVDGKLYVAVGDNANGANSQSIATRLGKILRYNDDGSIPADNPFFTSTSGDNRAIWALGLRNPFTFAVRAGDGRIHLNDVGQGTWEEIDLGVPGANYGWPQTEGPTTAAGITAPLFSYRHTDTNPRGTGPGGFFTGCAIIGGAFYPTSGAGATFPAAYRGSYFFTDLCSQVIGRMDLANGNAAYVFGRSAGRPVGLRVGQDGAVYVLTQTTIERFAAP